MLAWLFGCGGVGGCLFFVVGWRCSFFKTERQTLAALCHNWKPLSPRPRAAAGVLAAPAAPSSGRARGRGPMGLCRSVHGGQGRIVIMMIITVWFFNVFVCMCVCLSVSAIIAGRARGRGPIISVVVFD